jgi:tetratricopeptide (TPR) repeat protein
MIRCLHRPLGVALTCTLLAATAAHAQAPAPQRPRPAAPSGAEQQLVERARQLLQQGQGPQALAAAQEAQRRDPSDYKAAYYVAYSLMTLGEYDGAMQAQKRAMGLAKTPEQEAPVRALGDAIEASKGLLEADKALAEGLYAKAARQYAAAMDTGVGTPEAGIAGAKIFEERLNDLPSAARLLRIVQKSFPNSPGAKTADSMLARLQPALSREAEAKVEAAFKLPNGQRQKLFQEALDLDANNPHALLGLTSDAATRGAWPEFEKLAKQLQQQGRLEDALEGGKLFVGRWVDDPRLKTLLGDMMGEARVRTLLAKQAGMRDALRSRADGVYRLADAPQYRVDISFGPGSLTLVEPSRTSVYVERTPGEYQYSGASNGTVYALRVVARGHLQAFVAGSNIQPVDLVLMAGMPAKEP